MGEIFFFLQEKRYFVLLSFPSDLQLVRVRSIMKQYFFVSDFLISVSDVVSFVSERTCRADFSILKDRLQ